MPTRAEPPPPLRVNRAPVLTLWAAVVAERLGHPEDTALTLGSAVAGTAARVKARRLGIAEDRPEEDSARRRGDTSKEGCAVRLLGREIPVSRSEGAYSWPRTANVRSRPRPSEPTSRAPSATAWARCGRQWTSWRRRCRRTNSTGSGFRLYERFRPEVPEGVEGWGAKAVLDIGRIRQAAD